MSSDVPSDPSDTQTNPPAGWHEYEIDQLVAVRRSYKVWAPNRAAAREDWPHWEEDKTAETTERVIEMDVTRADGEDEPGADGEDDSDEGDPRGDDAQPFDTEAYQNHRAAVAGAGDDA